MEDNLDRLYSGLQCGKRTETVVFTLSQDGCFAVVADAFPGRGDKGSPRRQGDRPHDHAHAHGLRRRCCRCTNTPTWSKPAWSKDAWWTRKARSRSGNMSGGRRVVPAWRPRRKERCSSGSSCDRTVSVIRCRPFTAGSVRSEQIECAARNYLGIVPYVDVDFFILGTHADAEKTEPGGHCGFAWNPIGTNAREIERFVNLLGFSPMDATLSAARLSAHTSARCSACRWHDTYAAYRAIGSAYHDYDQDTA